MLPMEGLRVALATLLAADATTLAPVATPNKIALIMGNFTPNEELTFADLTLATFVGSTPIAGAAGAQGSGQDPVTLQQVITILSPVGGWRFVCTAGTSLPQTIYGFALVDNAVAVLLAVQKFPNPILISESGQELDLGAIDITFVLQPMS